MTLTTNDPLEILNRKAIIFILGAMILGGMLVTIINLIEDKTHPISWVIPPLTSAVSIALLIYLIKYPSRTYQVTKIIVGWSGFIIILFPEYFFVIEAWLDPKKRLVDTLPPISSGIFLLTTSMIIFLRPLGLVRLVLLFWFAAAAPIVVYLVSHLEELKSPRGLDIMVTLVPAMGINLSLVMFYSYLQDAINKLYIERFHLQEISEKDALTNVFNRGAGEKMLRNLIEQSNQQIGIILCDVDRFKQVNDNYGHLIGDRVLQTIAQCCQSNLRKKDTLIRWGGEEFLIVVTGDEEEELKYLAERLRSIIAEQQIPEVGKVTASFGVALLQPQENLSQLFTRADQALYQAKKQGRNQVIFT